ncbi:MAG: hypothetical protein WKG07_06405 [Hymenobacter sp.]
MQVLGVSTDITALKAAQLAAEEAAQASRELPGQHEPRNPHAHERRAGHGRAAGQNAPQPAAARVRAHHPQLGQPLAGRAE